MTENDLQNLHRKVNIE